MLEYAFEHLQFHRISIITDSRNLRSQKAIERIGAKKEGIIRSHLITHNNYIRDSISYSIIREEWETIKNHFHHKLFRENSSTPSISAGSITK
jgi:RimJ/RimL family protein N-acetyltransferase